MKENKMYKHKLIKDIKSTCFKINSLVLLCRLLDYKLIRIKEEICNSFK